MTQISSAPFIYVKEVWSEHSTEFYEQEAHWLLTNLAGRLRKQSFRTSQDLALSVLEYLFATDWFRSVRRGRSEAIILERKRGQIFFVIRMQDIPAIRTWANRRHQNRRHLRRSV